MNLIGEYTVAPFAFVKGAIIKRLHVAGSCYATICGAAGIVGNSLENEPATTISECWSSVYLKGGLEGSLQQSLGGIMIEPRCQATIADCLFTGSFDESNTYYCGGFVNWTDAHITFKNCLNLGTYVCESEYDGGTFIREDSDWGGATFDNIYFKNAYGRIQGEQVTDEQLSDGSVAAALQQNREDQVWIQDAELGIPMLAVFVHTDAGIATPEASSSAIVPWYTLDGRRISTPTRGHIYVSNGKKVIVK